ncbi:unnamed protein product [Phytophthora lilii]|uniref:Unnamed protein product n=1 Tax=Phytophthora lilii TaxID=2077276 RepID=A0A9W6U3Y6_9STRA|nr:unnamed protein product [Phytophthora lilii]
MAGTRSPLAARNAAAAPSAASLDTTRSGACLLTACWCRIRTVKSSCPAHFPFLRVVDKAQFQWLLLSSPRSRWPLHFPVPRCSRGRQQHNLVGTADAHQVVLLPAPTYTTDNKDTKYAPLAFLENQGYSTVEHFNGWRRSNGYKTLRAFMDGAKYTATSGADYYCGFTNANAAPQPIPDGTMRSTGYTHDGPCEVWLDSTRVLAADNCHESIVGKTYNLDYSSCKGTCTLRWYWLGVRYLKQKYSWQVYKACVPLSASARRLEGAANGSVALEF